MAPRAPAIAERQWEVGDVWRRFRDAPAAIRALQSCLRNAEPRDLLVDQPVSRRSTKSGRPNSEMRWKPPLAFRMRQACDRIVALEGRTRHRSGWVWADLVTARWPSLWSRSPASQGWRARRLAVHPSRRWQDYAAEAGIVIEPHSTRLNGAKSPSDNALIAKVVRALYAPWLDKSARKFQELATHNQAEYRRLASGVDAEPETCVVFADGLRFDVAGMLQERLEQRGLRVEARPPDCAATHGHGDRQTCRFAGPGPRVKAGASSEDFNPVLSSSKQSVNASRLRDQMARQGIEILEPDETTLAAKTERAAGQRSVAWMRWGIRWASRSCGTSKSRSKPLLIASQRCSGPVGRAFAS